MLEVFLQQNKLIIKYLLILFILGPNKVSDFDAKIQRLKDMGIDENQARACLSKENWDLEKATESLFS